MRPGYSQSGYALLLVLLVLMGAGGVVLAGFTQQVKHEAERQRYEHNQRVLREAKQALLMYAYNYPQSHGRGPGRLPCPDTDDPVGGVPDGMPNSSFFCDSGAPMVGRFPFRDPNLSFYEAHDASGEHLWYAVSSNFANSGPAIVNSNTVGTITLVDSTGRILYDGAADGIAAVIIAPGAVVRRDDNGNGDYEYVQVRQTDSQRGDPRNYLDTFGDFDNSVFNNAESDSDEDGFILGPVFDSAVGDTVVNDQFVIVTADEILEMAEKKVLETYRDAIRDYLDKTGGVYPWLYNYDGVEYNLGAGEPDTVAIDKLSSFFPAETSFTTEKDTYLGIDNSGSDDGIFGRIPSIFGGYFTETGGQSIETRIDMEIALIDPLASDTLPLTETYCKDDCPEPVVSTFYYDSVDQGPKLTFNISQVLTDVEFVDIEPDVVGKDGRLSVTFASSESKSFERYFWDGDNDPDYYWRACPAGGNELLDCSRDSSGNPTPGVTNGYKSRILHMTISVEFDGVEDFVFDYSAPLPNPVITPGTGSSHATITQTYPAANIISFPGTITATYEFERHWHDGEGGTSLEIDNNTYTQGTVDLSGVTIRSLKLGMRYYPELPSWALDNGWHNSVRMAYALEYEPPGIGPCNVGSTCLQLDDAPGSPRNVAALLVIGGSHDWEDGDAAAIPPIAPNGRLRDELLDVFDNGNHNNNPTFYRRRGDDRLLVIEQL